MGERLCADCGHRATAFARFCERCGAALRPGAEPLRAPGALEARILDGRRTIEGERKQVTVMYTDIVGSMELTRALEAERWGYVLDRFLAIAAGAVHAFEGTVNQFTGDGLLAVFGAPLAHEDHARRACLAVLELQREVAGLSAEIARDDGAEFAIRCGLNSGEVVVGAIGDDVHMDFVPLGNTTGLGKRIESLAPPGSTAISASTAALVDGEFELRELGEFEVKGVDTRQRVLELVGRGAAQTRLQAVAATRGLSRFVGRDDERAALESALEHALAGNGHAVGVVGDAGVGKSRLVHEFGTGCAARGVLVVSTAAIAHGRYVPFSTVLALYRAYFGIEELDAPGIARGRIETAMLALDPLFAQDLPLLFDFLGVPDPDRPPELMDAPERQRRLLAVLARSVEARSRNDAAVLVIEDLHWLDDASAVFLQALVAASVGTRTVLVATYRPGYEAAWVRTAPHAQVGVGVLDAGATDDLLGELLGDDESVDGLRALIATRTGGNPFFVEEVVQALAENGHLEGVRGAHRLASPLDELVLPPTVQAVLSARLDRLHPREKALVQTMSVIGSEISRPLLSEVSGLGARELAEAVEVLSRAQWIVAGDTAGGAEYAFKHPLTQEVAYGSQLSDRRSRAHHAVATAMQRTFPDRLDERASLLAHHYEASGDKLEGAAWHARAATWAERSSLADSLRHWRRVRHLTTGLDPSPEVEALAAKARIGILGMVWRLGLSSDETAAVRAEARADTGQGLLELATAGALLHTRREAEGLERFRRTRWRAITGGNAGEVLTASVGVAYASWVAGSLREGLAALDGALALAGDDPAVGSGMPFICPLAHAHKDRAQCLGYMGDLDLARSVSDRGIALARAREDPETESAAHASRAMLEAQLGDAGAAYRHSALGLAIADGVGNVSHAVACSVPAAVADAGTGRFAPALERAQSDLATIRRHGVGHYFEPVLLATVARARLGLGEAGDACAAAEEGVGIMTARGLTTCALAAPVALAEVLLATDGAAARERVEDVLGEALRVAAESGARALQPRIRRGLAAGAAGHVATP